METLMFDRDFRGSFFKPIKIALSGMNAGLG
jgi:hypothetical protein